MLTHSVAYTYEEFGIGSKSESKESESSKIRVRIKREREIQKAVDLEIYLDPKQHTDFLKHYVHMQRGVDSHTLCYTAILQRNIARYRYAKLGEKDAKATDTSSTLSDKIQHAWYRYTGFFKKALGFSAENEKNVNQLLEVIGQCSEQLADLEELINHPPEGDVHTVIDDLKNRVEIIYAAINLKLSQYQEQNSSASKVIERLRGQLKDTEESFLARLDAQKDIHQTEDPLSLIFSLQDRRADTASLGSYVAQQVIGLCAGGIDAIYKIGGRGIQLLQLHPGVKCLSDTKSELSARARALHGVGRTNSRSPYSQSMIMSLRPSEAPTGDGAWIKVSDYVENGLGDLEEIDKLLCYLTQQSLHARKKHPYAVFLKIGLFFASVVELVIHSPLHLLFTAMSVFYGLLLYVVPSVLFTCFFTVSSILVELIGIIATPFGGEALFDTLRSKINAVWERGNRAFQHYKHRLNVQVIDDTGEILHHKLSCVRWCKNKLEEGYERTEKTSTHHRVLTGLKGHTVSLFNQLLSQYSGHSIATGIENYLSRTIHSVTGAIRELFFLIEPKNAAKRQKVFKERAAQVTALKGKIEKHLQSRVSKQIDSHEHKAEKNAYWPLIIPQPMNTIPSLVTFPEEIVLGFFKGLTDSAFRTNGLSATALFALSCVTLGALSVPSATKLAGLRHFCGALTKLFGQNMAEDSIPLHIVGVTLQWQVLYASYEGSKSLFLGETELIRWIFENSEKIVLGLSGAAVTGKLLQYIPSIPTLDPEQSSRAMQTLLESVHPLYMRQTLNYLLYPLLSPWSSYFTNSFPEMLNKLSEESGSVGRHGIHPFKDFEQAIFGVKFLLLLHSLISTGDHLAHVEEMLSDVRAPDDSQEPAALSDLENARQELSKAICTAEQYTRFKTLHHALQPDDMSEDPASGRTRAKLYFDYLSEKFAQYREELEKQGLYHKTLDDYEHAYLHSFFNKECYESNTTLIRLISLALFYPLTLLYRGFNYYIAGTAYFYSPAIRQQITMDFAQDAALVFQILGLVAWIAKGTLRPVGYVLRGVMGLPIILIGSVVVGIGYGPSAIKPFFNSCLDFFANFTPHRLDLTAWLRPMYGRVSHLAGINCDDLPYATQRLLVKLEKDKSVAVSKEAEQTASEETSTSACLIAKLSQYQRKVKQRWRPTDSARAQQIKMISGVMHDSSKDEKAKCHSIAPLYRALPQGSELKQAIEKAGFFKYKAAESDSSFTHNPGSVVAAQGIWT